MAARPQDLRTALSSSPKLQAQWNALTSIGQRDFISWITSAKKAETREHRIATLGSRLASGKKRPCCFAVVPMGLYTALGEDAKAKVTWSGLTPDERRDFVDWINAVKSSEEQKQRVDKVCTMLAKGKRYPK